MFSFKDMVEVIAKLALASWISIARAIPFALWAAAELLFAAAPFVAVYCCSRPEFSKASLLVAATLMAVLGRYGLFRLALSQRAERCGQKPSTYRAHMAPELVAAYYGSPWGAGQVSLRSAVCCWFVVKLIGSLLAVAAFAVFVVWYRSTAAISCRLPKVAARLVVATGISSYIFLSAVVGGEVWLIVPQISKDGDDYPLWLAWASAPIYIFMLAGLGGTIWHSKADRNPQVA